MAKAAKNHSNADATPPLTDVSMAPADATVDQSIAVTTTDDSAVAYRYRDAMEKLINDKLSHVEDTKRERADLQTQIDELDAEIEPIESEIEELRRVIAFAEGKIAEMTAKIQTGTRTAGGFTHNQEWDTVIRRVLAEGAHKADIISKELGFTAEKDPNRQKLSRYLGQLRDTAKVLTSNGVKQGTKWKLTGSWLAAE